MASGVRVREMRRDDLSACGALMSDWNAMGRRSEPSLPPAWVEPSVCEAEIAELAAAADALAMVAERDDHVVGFMVAGPRPSGPWGQDSWVELGGHAARTPEDIRDLWAAVASVMAVRGRTEHYVVAPANQRDVVDAWFRLGFGQSHVYALTDRAPTLPPLGRGVVLRPATTADVGALTRLDMCVLEHQRSSPVFSAGPAVSEQEVRDDWVQTLADGMSVVWVAESGGVVVAGAMGCSADRSSMHRGPARPPGAGLLAWASVSPEHRGLGIGVALGGRVTHDLLEAGAPCVLTDWRATNLQASRAWVGLGFRPTFLRLHRRLGF